MSSNKLRLNIDKTKFMWIGTTKALRSLQDHKKPVLDLGVLLDHELSMNNYITDLCRKCFYQLRRIKCIRRSLTPDSVKTLVHSFVCSKVDYCNVVLYGTKFLNFGCIQSVLNAAARLIAGVPKFQSISTYVHDDLHWLQVGERIDFKIALIVRDCLMGEGPDYLQELVKPVSEIFGRKHLRSSNHGDLVVTSHKTEKYGKRRFLMSSAKIWNGLPVQLKTIDVENREMFKKRLKHHLFN